MEVARRERKAKEGKRQYLLSLPLFILLSNFTQVYGAK
jgi:hypothetical protein